MLTRLTVKGFKSLRHVEVDLGVVNVLIGPNGSGKSNLLEALGVLGAVAAGSVEPKELRHRGVRLGLPTSSFRGQRPLQAITLQARSEEAAYRAGLKAPVGPRAPWRVRSEYLAVGSKLLFARHGSQTRVDIPPLNWLFKRTTTAPAKVDEAQALHLLATSNVVSGAEAPRPPEVQEASDFLERLGNFAIFSPSTPVLRGEAADVERRPLGLGGSGLPLVIRGLLRQQEQRLGAFDLEDVWQMIEWAEGVAASSEMEDAPWAVPDRLEFADRFMPEGRNQLLGRDASEGALYVLFMLALVSHPLAPRLFAIDNFEQGLHPRLAVALTRMVAQHLVRTSQEDGRQMLVTTHNPLVLDGLDLRDDRIRLFAVERDRTGATQVSRILLTQDLLAEVDRGLPLSRMWLMGLLGAVPRLL
jgi:energy-coupling factor transporter ATP-binding protein EcfA2